MLVIAVSGKMGSGKDYIVSKYIIPYIQGVLNKRCLHVCFADQLKVLAIVRGSVSYTDVFVKKTHESRALLQVEGTQNARSKDPDIWIRYLDTWAEIYRSRNIDVFVISDLRFKNEFDWVRSKCGVVIRVKAPERNKERLMQESNGDINVSVNLKSHVSELGLDDLSEEQYDIVINNDFTDIIDTQLLYSVIEKKIDEK